MAAVPPLPADFGLLLISAFLKPFNEFLKHAAVSGWTSCLHSCQISVFNEDKRQEV